MRADGMVEGWMSCNSLKGLDEVKRAAATPDGGK